MGNRNVQKVKFGMCLNCGCSREEGYDTWCKKCQEEMQESHTRKLSAN